MLSESERTELSRKRVFTTGEAAALCKVSQQTIIRCFDSGRLNGFRVPGSKFRRIPREELLRFMRANDIPTGLMEHADRPRILAVDDDPAILDLYKGLLARDGRYDLREATTGYDAGLLTESFRPHLILLDYMLPDINGAIVCRRLRENPALAGTRVLCISGMADESVVQELRQAGADDFLMKPFEGRHLCDRVDALLAPKQAAEETR